MLQIVLKWMPVNHVYSLIFCRTYFVEVVFFLRLIVIRKRKTFAILIIKDIHFVEMLTFQHFIKTSAKNDSKRDLCLRG